VANDSEIRRPEPDCESSWVRRELVRLYEEHRSNGTLPTSSRFLFYELVARKVIAKDAGQRPDQVVIKALTQLREWGVIPWDAIVDETREVSNFTGSATVADDLLLYLHAARLDPWDGEPPLILTESRSLVRCATSPGNTASTSQRPMARPTASCVRSWCAQSRRKLVSAISATCPTLTRTCCATPAVICWLMPGTTHAGCNFGSATLTSSIRPGIRN
jgi:hypothetical protein